MGTASDRIIILGEPGMSPEARPESSDQDRPGESSHMRELAMRRQTDTPDLTNPEQERDCRESQTEPGLDELELGTGVDFREPEVLAVRHEEFGQLLRGMNQEERLKIRVRQP
jgi:hypothetical protein